MQPGLTKLAFVLFFIVQAVLWSHSRYARSTSTLAGLTHQRAYGHARVLGYSKRSASSVLPLLGATDHFEESECAPLSVPWEEQCHHTRTSCETSDTVLSIPYLQAYFCASPSARPFIFAALALWLLFLFSTLGISASDFFCPNLATLAELLGLDENVAGVTFLAFGNGSPDVFSTFSAMRAHAGSLAIGELLGAASFIVSVVVGSMCLIKPFKVDPKPFLRDVGFFTTAVTLLLWILWDGEIRLWEAMSLVVLYVVYALVVVVGTWWQKRQFRIKLHEQTVRNEYAEEEMPEPPTFFEPYRDEPSPPASPERLNVPPPTRLHSSPVTPHLRVDTGHQHHRHRSSSRSPSPTPSVIAPRMSQMPSFSLVGALEFRQVVASLQNLSSGAALSVFDAPVTPYIGGHYYHRTLSRSHSRSAATRRRRRSSAYYSTHSGYSDATTELDPWDADGVPMRSPRGLELHLQDGAEASSGSTIALPQSQVQSQPHDDTLRPPSGVPFIATTPASPSTPSLDNEALSFPPPSRRQRVWHALRHTCHVLFPTLQNFRRKSWLGMLASILAAPAVLGLTLTLPVHVIPRGYSDTEEKAFSDRMSTGTDGPVTEGRLVDFEEEGIERVLTAEEADAQEELADLTFNKWLMAAQVLIGPQFCVAVLFSGVEHQGWLALATAVASLAASIVVLVFADHGNDRVAQIGRCFMGFFVAVVWIMAIADEVVNVLKTFGLIFGLSDAIIGLTIFAVGNSLADFVANISIAAFAPVMGFSACFGGPMLNILLGVGVSGSYVINSTGVPYILHFSSTLLVSTIGLLVLLWSTMVFVPLNGFHLPKRWGVFLIVCYIIIMTINVIVEVMR